MPYLLGSVQSRFPQSPMSFTEAGTASGWSFPSFCCADLFRRKLIPIKNCWAHCLYPDKGEASGNRVAADVAVPSRFASGPLG